MKNWFKTYMVLIVLASTMTVFAEPKEKPEDKSQKAWLELKKKVEAEVEQEVEKAFKDKIVFAKSFGDRVYKLGSTVKVTRTIGRARMVEGLFRELKAIGKGTVEVDNNSTFVTKDFYAVISNTKYRLNDLDSESALKLLYGGLPVAGETEAIKEALRMQAIQNYVASKLAKIAKDKNFQREQLKNDRFAKAGYNEMFFASNVLIKDNYHSPIDLGIHKLILRVDIPRSPKIPCAEFKLQLRCPFDGAVVLRLGDKAIASSTMDYTKPAEASLEKYVMSGFISKKDLGSNPAMTIAKAQVQFICSGIDSTWVAKAKGTTHPKNSTQYRTELIGFSMVKSTFGKVTSTIKVDLKSAVWNAKDYQGKRDKEMAPFIIKKVEAPVKPATPAPAPKAPAPKAPAPAPAAKRK